MAGSFLRRNTHEARRARRHAYLRRMARLLRVGIAAADRIDRASGEPPEENIRLAPPRNGTRIRVLEVPPEDPSIAKLTPEQARAHFAEVGAAAAASPFMRRAASSR